MLSVATFVHFVWHFGCNEAQKQNTKQNSGSVCVIWPLWVHVNCTWTLSLDNVYLLVNDSTFASTNNKYLEDSHANWRDLLWPAVECCSSSAIDLRFCWWGPRSGAVSGWSLLLFSVLSESNRRKNRSENCSTAASQSGCVHLGSIEGASYATMPSIYATQTVNM